MQKKILPKNNPPDKTQSEPQYILSTKLNTTNM